MQKYIKKLIKEVISEVIEEKFTRIARISAQEAHYNLFSYIGVTRMQEILDEIKKAPKGYQDYTSLAEMYSITMRNNLKNNLWDVREHLFKIYPELKSLNRKVEDL